MDAEQDILGHSETPNQRSALLRDAELLVLRTARPVYDVRRLRRLVSAATPILIVSPSLVPALDALTLGVDGYLVEGEFTMDELRFAVRRTADHQAALSPSVMRLLLGKLRQRPPAIAPVSLTSRELQILGAFSTGSDNRQVATDLHLAERTIRNTASRIYSKIGVRSRTEAVLWLLRREGDAD